MVVVGGWGMSKPNPSLPDVFTAINRMYIFSCVLNRKGKINAHTKSSCGNKLGITATKAVAKSFHHLETKGNVHQQLRNEKVQSNSKGIQSHDILKIYSF